MTERRAFFGWLLLACVLLRLPAMIWMPLVDTSEPRYAEIARLMLVKDDWITLWFNPDLPFWGKPPLAFWCQALSMKLFGIHEWAARLPAGIAILATATVLWRMTRALYGEATGLLATLVFCTMGLSCLAGAAVLTDPFLTLGTTLTLSGFLMAGRTGSLPWIVAVFAGMTLALLSKGPIGMIILAVPVVVTAVFHREFRRRLAGLPWLAGIIGVLLTSLPWYVAAELKTPGFLNYFIVGEHIMRFIDSGWQGDLYGSAHNRPRGMIWLYGLQATLPWGPALLVGLATALWRKRGRLPLGCNRSETDLFLVMWALVCGLFFTTAGNILWTYWMPSLPAIAVLAARTAGPFLKRHPLLTVLLSLLIPLGACTMTLVAHTHPEKVKTEKYVLARAQGLMQPGDRIVYLHKAPFSGRFYSGGNALEAERADLVELLPTLTGRCLLIATHKATRALGQETGQTFMPVARSRDYQLLVVERDSALWNALAGYDTRGKH